MNVLIVLGRPRTDRRCGPLARAYREGAVESGNDVRELELAQVETEPNVERESTATEYLEPDPVDVRQQVRWADHLVFVYPHWPGAVPAQRKAFFERAFTPGVAFSSYGDAEGAGHEEALADRTAELIVTTDAPARASRWLYRRPETGANERETPEHVGIRTARVTPLGPVADSTPAERERRLEKARRLGRSLTDGPEPRTARLKRRVGTALKALRLQFYPMAWVAYTVGALAVSGSSELFTSALYWIGFGFLFFLEATTVLTNEYFDYETDRENPFAGPFTGGSRILVDGEASFAAVRRGAGVTLALAGLFGLGALALGRGQPLVTAGVMAAFSLLAIGYTVPPLQLSYRTLGELAVAATQSIGVLLFGFVSFGGSWTDPTPWLLSAPLFLATIPSITLAGVPDCEADRAAGKRTIAVRFGVDRAATVASATTLLAALVAVLWQFLGVVPGAYGPAIYLCVPHALGLVWGLETRLNADAAPTRIDGLMAVSLGYVLWFGAVPLIGLL